MKTTNTRLRYARFIYLLLTAAFAACVFVQIYIAGIAIFADVSAWMKHMTFVHIFGFNLPLFMLVFAILGRMPRWSYWQIFGVFLSIFLMYFTANFKSVVPFVGPMHVIFAIVLLVLSCFIVKNSWTFIFSQNKSEEE
mgnify:CR=1 FL=1